jgi:type I restriction enzyme M protein
MTALELTINNKNFDLGTDQAILGVQPCCLMNDEFTLPLEAATRKRIDLILTNLGWNIDEFSSNCNVFAERTKTKEQQNLLKKISGYKKPPDYVLYQHGTDKPIAIIEAKRPSQSLEKALKTGNKKLCNSIKC